MLQCRIWGRGTGNTCEVEALTQGNTTKIYRSIPALSFLSVFAFSVRSKLYDFDKI